MIDRNEWREIIESLKKNKSRTLMTAFGIFWGIFMLIVLLGAGDGLENGVANSFKGYNLSSTFVWTDNTTIPYEGMKENRKIELTNDDITFLKKKFGDKIQYISPRSSAGLQKVSYAKIFKSYDISAMGPDMIYIKNVQINFGRYINYIDEKEFRPVAVIGKSVQNRLFGDKEPIGKTIKVGNAFYIVVGVFQSLAEAEQAENDNKRIYIPFSTYQKNFNQGIKVGALAFVADNEETENEVMSTLKRLHKVSPKDKDGIGSWSTRDTMKQFQGLFKAIRMLMWVVGIGTLLSGIVGVSNIMVINIKERTKEIGIRKAIGATPFSIIKTIVLESVFLTSISGYFGLSFGLCLVEGINFGLNYVGAKSNFFMNPQINLFVVVVSIIVLVVAGFFAAFMPARNAAMIRPIEALREE